MSELGVGAAPTNDGGVVLDAERRLDTLIRLIDDVRSLESPDDVMRQAVEILSGNTADLPALGFYRVAGAGTGELQVVAVAGTFEAHSAEAAIALAREVARCGQRQERLVAAPGNAGAELLHAFPLAEVALDQPSTVLVIQVPAEPASDYAWRGYVTMLVAQLSGILTGLQELASERLRSRLLSQLDAAKSAFFANISHELRTPLSLISAPVHDALLEPDLPERVVQRLRLAQHNVARLTRMVDAMLDFSRMEAGRIGPALADVDVSALTGALADSFAPVMEQAGLAFVTHIPALPRTAHIDRDMYERMVLNLLANALKYTPEGAVTLRLVDAGDRFRLAVTDTGIGIPAADKHRIFARFVQLPPHPLARSKEGAGIGLAMVAQLADLLGGRVSVDSQVGHGSTFTLDLPYDSPTAVMDLGTGVRSVTRRDADSFLTEMSSWQGLDDGSAPDPTADGGAPPHRAGRRLKLLVVEDNADLRAYLTDVLSDDFDIRTAADGEEALSTARAWRPHVILSDVMMPAMDGLALTRAIRQDPDLTLVPVLLLSARAGQGDVTDAMDGGADDYIQKPFSVSELRSRVSSTAALALARSSDASWRRAVIGSLQTALLISDPDGLVTEVNERFTAFLGWSLADGPLRPPYPWWPDPVVDPEAFERIATAHDGIAEDRPMTGEYQLRRRDGRTVWASYWGVFVTSPELGRTAFIKSLTDVTREHDSRKRREAASRIVASFANADDLDRLLADAVRGFGVLFDGRAQLRVLPAAGSKGRRDLAETVFTDEGTRPVAELDPTAPRAPAGEADQPTTGTPMAGIVIENEATTHVRCRTWVEFPVTRVVPPDELIVGDLLARALDIAVDRLLAAEDFARREENLQRAIESHRFVGQAVGVLVERHRITPAEAFDRLSEASQNRNIKLRELASRVLETGADPQDA